MHNDDKVRYYVPARERRRGPREEFLRAREAMRLTQRDLARLLGVPRSRVLNYERGDMAIPLRLQLAMRALARKQRKLDDEIRIALERIL